MAFGRDCGTVGLMYYRFQYNCLTLRGLDRYSPLGNFNNKVCFDLTEGGEGAANFIIKNVYLEQEVLFSSQVTMMVTKSRGRGAPAQQQQLSTGSALYPPLPIGLGGVAISYFCCSIELHQAQYGK